MPDLTRNKLIVMLLVMTGADYHNPGQREVAGEFIDLLADYVRSGDGDG